MITIFKPADITVTVIDGEPPTDQSATVAALVTQVSQLEGERDAALSELAASLSVAAALQAKINAALTALA